MTGRIGVGQGCQVTQTINKIGVCCALLLFSLSAVASELDLGSIGLELWESLEEERAESRDSARYLLGLSPLQKIRGEWRHRKIGRAHV